MSEYGRFYFPLDYELLFWMDWVGGTIGIGDYLCTIPRFITE